MQLMPAERRKRRAGAVKKKKKGAAVIFLVIVEEAKWDFNQSQIKGKTKFTCQALAVIFLLEYSVTSHTTLC